jgi:membrane associated rhomboid family serine protease
MGLNDRDYARYGEQPGFHVGPPRSATVQLMLATGAVYLAQFAFPAVNQLALEADWFRQPWKAYELLTYGFLHSLDDVTHILLNMLMLWFFGREIEQRYGRGEYVTLYLASIVIAGLVWSLCEYPFGPAEMVGASGGISALFALYALNWPHRKVLFMFVIPMPMWVAALIALVMDANGAMQRSGDVAFTAHLAGAAFGAAYYLGNWRLASWFTGAKNWLPNPSRPRLRVHEPDDSEPPEDDLTQQVDDILRKIQEKGQDSLTKSERRLLERASREFQQKRK